MAFLLKDLQYNILENMLISKIRSSFPPGYKSIFAAWTNISKEQQITFIIQEIFLWHKNLFQMQGTQNIPLILFIYLFIYFFPIFFENYSSFLI